MARRLWCWECRPVGRIWGRRVGLVWLEALRLRMEVVKIRGTTFWLCGVVVVVQGGGWKHPRSGISIQRLTFEFNKVKRSLSQRTTHTSIPGHLILLKPPPPSPSLSLTSAHRHTAPPTSAPNVNPRRNPGGSVENPYMRSGARVASGVARCRIDGELCVRIFRICVVEVGGRGLRGGERCCFDR